MDSAGFGVLCLVALLASSALGLALFGVPGALVGGLVGLVVFVLTAQANAGGTGADPTLRPDERDEDATAREFDPTRRPAEREGDEE
ncbi:hypothetical protein EFA46_004010 [Halarchaeum sp. CBA1220]|uniref:hypothetical protein n=1 Tax=Halarchaeum sp. CBA1220 TaxID=1853682 RepID=UPI000F3A8409|nr:hypothetical protein [Halarchaeum sp. CBA1220]QLC33399.1 hypothetical protein EFA46_004010 [Halarchaeum sp. CBA1220]